MNPYEAHNIDNQYYTYLLRQINTIILLLLSRRSKVRILLPSPIIIGPPRNWGPFWFYKRLRKGSLFLKPIEHFGMDT